MSKDKSIETNDFSAAIARDPKFLAKALEGNVDSLAKVLAKEPAILNHLVAREPAALAGAFLAEPAAMKEIASRHPHVLSRLAASEPSALARPLAAEPAALAEIAVREAANISSALKNFDGGREQLIKELAVRKTK